MASRLRACTPVMGHFLKGPPLIYGGYSSNYYGMSDAVSGACVWPQCPPWVFTMPGDCHPLGQVASTLRACVGAVLDRAAYLPSDHLESLWQCAGHCDQQDQVGVGEAIEPWAGVAGSDPKGTLPVLSLSLSASSFCAPGVLSHMKR